MNYGSMFSSGALPDRRRKSKPEPDTEATVFAWNQQHPVGTPVEYRPVLGQKSSLPTKTTSVAWLMGGHSAVVKIEGVSGGVALRNLTPIPEAKPSGTNS